MKKIIMLFLISGFLYSCKKEKPYNPDEHIVYNKWVQLRNSTHDTLFAVYIPNAFTPNGDGSNDMFVPKIYYSSWLFTLTFNFEIFNNNNQLIFRSTDVQGSFHNSWNGYFNNGHCPVGTYTYKFTVTYNVDTYEYSGNVLLIN